MSYAADVMTISRVDGKVIIDNVPAHMHVATDLFDHADVSPWLDYDHTTHVLTVTGDNLTCAYKIRAHYFDPDILVADLVE